MDPAKLDSRKNPSHNRHNESVPFNITFIRRAGMRAGVEGQRQLQ